MSLLFSCDTTPPSERLDTPTSGTISIVVDETLQPLTDQLIETFEASYPKAFLPATYSPENAVLNGLIADSSRFAVMARALTTEEVAFFKAKTFGVEQVNIGYDAIAFIVNRANTDSVFTTAQLIRMLTGKDTLWKQIRESSVLGRIDVVFDNPGSSTIHFLTDSLLKGAPLGRNCFAINSNQAVVEYVNTHANAIGVVGLNWIGDKDNSSDRERRAMISLAAIGDSISTATTPHQTALALNTYPFRRPIYLIKIGSRPGLGTGFASFAYSERGQLIVQKAGLLPAKPAERHIELKTN